MENASKALLIAAAVLIVILVIAMSMRIYNGSGDIASDAEEVGKSIIEGSKDASKGAISSLSDINSKNLLKITDRTIKLSGSPGEEYYKEDITNVYLEPNKNYRLKFNYSIEENTENSILQCTIGKVELIKTQTGLITDGYKESIKKINYTDSKKGYKGEVIEVFKVEEPIRLGIRLVRRNTKNGIVEVKISNVELREVK